MNNSEPIKLIFICNQEGKVVNMLAPNHIGRTTQELLLEAHRLANELGGHVEVSSRFGGPTQKHTLKS